MPLSKGLMNLLPSLSGLESRGSQTCDGKSSQGLESLFNCSRELSQQGIRPHIGLADGADALPHILPSGREVPAILSLLDRTSKNMRNHRAS